MKVTVLNRPEQWKSDCLLIPVFTDASPLGLISAFPNFAWLKQSGAFAEHKGELGEITLCHAPKTASGRRSGVQRILALGLGRKRHSNMHIMYNTALKALNLCRERKYANPAIFLPILEWTAGTQEISSLDVLENAILATLKAGYSYQEFLSTPGFAFDSLVVLASGRIPAACKAVIAKAEAIDEGRKLARDLVNAPANVLSPEKMAEEARNLAARHGLSCKVLEKTELERLGMNALLATARGSANAPKFIVLEHNPGGKPNRAPLVLIGKGLTFDSGGLCLKPAAGMERMKTDMAGAAAVLGAFEAIGRNPAAVKARVIGLIPCVENMPDGSAMRPGDIVRTMRGITVEITNTDAEGRLALCDALAYAQQEWSPAAIVDIATLTGACTVALGRGAGGLFCADERLCRTILDLGEKTDTLLWRLPLWEELRPDLKSHAADTANSGSRDGGAILAALFLKLFVDEGINWAHLDMSAAGYTAKGNFTECAGATGYGVRLLYELARGFSARAGK